MCFALKLGSSSTHRTSFVFLNFVSLEPCSLRYLGSHGCTNSSKKHDTCTTRKATCNFRIEIIYEDLQLNSLMCIDSIQLASDRHQYQSNKIAMTAHRSHSSIPYQYHHRHAQSADRIHFFLISVRSKALTILSFLNCLI